MSDLMLDVGQAQEIKMAARRAGATNADLKALSESDMFSKILLVLRGQAEVALKKHMIDLSADPLVPNGWTVVEHKKGGILEWDPMNVQTHCDEGQKDDKHIRGYELRKKLEGERVLNANVLDHLLSHPELIPEDWKRSGFGRYFWGTIYHRPGGPGNELFVRCLGWSGAEWVSGGFWLDDDWRSLHRALVLSK